MFRASARRFWVPGPQVAKDEFYVTYHGEPLSTPMVTLVTNALQYYLSLNEVRFGGVWV